MVKDDITYVVLLTLGIAKFCQYEDHTHIKRNKVVRLYDTRHDSLPPFSGHITKCITEKLHELSKPKLTNLIERIL